tara:strand:+ start:383 stop:535 length:153 start_codon:yes stop_codon:yes gene_type:complete
MDKETLIRLATPASIFLLALSIFTIPFTATAYSEMRIKGIVTVDCIGGCS